MPFRSPTAASKSVQTVAHADAADATCGFGAGGHSGAGGGGAASEHSGAGVDGAATD